MARIDLRGSAGLLWLLPEPCGGCRCCSDRLHFVAVCYVIDPRPQASNPVSRFVCPSAVAGWRNHFLQPTRRQQGGKVVSGPARASETGDRGPQGGGPVQSTNERRGADEGDRLVRREGPPGREGEHPPRRS